MARDPNSGPAQHNEDDTQAAGGGPKVIGHPTYAEVALQLLENGYEPLPLRPGEKRPAVEGWTTIAIDEAQVDHWRQIHARAGIGLRTGHLVGIDIDILDDDIAHEMGQIVEATLGSPLMRVGLWPKRLFLCRTETPFAKLQIGKLEILGQGQQLVAFGIHPGTQKPYYWPGGESPLDVPLDQLPIVDEVACRDLLCELATLLPAAGEEQRSRRRGERTGFAAKSPVRNADGVVTDGRDNWLSILAFHAVHDSQDASQVLDPKELTETVWQHFQSTTDLSRGKQGGCISYVWADAQKKVREKLRLADQGRLPPRKLAGVEPVPVDPGQPVDEAREELRKAISEFVARTRAWLEGSREDPAPRVGLRASVGLGKTAVSRELLRDMQHRLKLAGLPHKIIIVTPSLALADESRVDWDEDGLRVAVHRGYEANEPGSDRPMCHDVEMVRMAVAAGLSVFPNACMRRGDGSCHNFEVCAKQDNLTDVSKADVVLAAYDSLFTGLPLKPEKVALLVIDEGCWERAIKRTTLPITEITRVTGDDQPRMEDLAEEERAWAELFATRRQAVVALQSNGLGVLSRQHLLDAGLTFEVCERACALEILLRPDPALRPGLPQGARRQAAERSLEAKRSVELEALFRALAGLLQSATEQDGRICIVPPDTASAPQAVQFTSLHKVHGDLGGLPILHLDATLRRELAETVLPGLEVVEITAEMPHLHLTAVQGRFAKTTLVADAKADPVENRRRANRLKECVDYVRWNARRLAPGRTLVVTYMGVEDAFRGIPGVVTGHFKAIAGLDIYKDVALLIVIGRPMPSDHDIAGLSGAYLGHVPTGGYRQVRRGVLMRNGSRRAFVVRQHEDPRAEALRAAVCDDEVIQAIGRARGVNRTEQNPVEIHLLADVALPLRHDKVISWDLVSPDIFQRMLLSSFAVDSPADAVSLHADLFDNTEQAKKAFQRGVFGGHFPISTYREMSLKSALYRRGGRGRSWQTAWWLNGDAADARSRLEKALGALDGWQPS